MSDQWRPGAVISLEEIFRSREFGRRPARRQGAPVAAVEATDPPRLEEVFLSELFGHPEAIAVPAPFSVSPAVPSVVGPTLVLLPGGADPQRDFTRHRGAIGAVSGVAAAALVVAGMTSGTGSRSQQPTISAEGQPPDQGPTSGGGSRLLGPGGFTTSPTGAAPVSGQPSAATGGVPGGSPPARLATGTGPAPATVAVAAPAPAPVAVVPSPPPPGGGTSPSGPSPGGGGNVLTPVLVTAGNTVSTVGSTVTAASSDLAAALPAASPVSGLLSNVGSTVTNLGTSIAGA
jgi:hypothetical protein